MTEIVSNLPPREPGVDYSEQAWSIAGLPPVTTLDDAMALVEQIENPEGAS